MLSQFPSITTQFTLKNINMKVCREDMEVHQAAMEDMEARLQAMEAHRAEDMAVRQADGKQEQQLFASIYYN